MGNSVSQLYNYRLDSTGPIIKRIPVEVHEEFVRYMDMPSLVSWRRTCKTHYLVVVRCIDRELEAMVQYYVPDRRSFMSLLHERRAVISGEAALSFLLRDTTVLSGQMDVYVGSREGPMLVRDLTEIWGLFNFTFIGSHTRFRLLLTTTEVQRDVRLRCETTGRDIVIHISSTRSALSPITRAWASCLINYVGMGGAGCGHPALTFQRRSLLGRPASHHAGEDQVQARLLGQGRFEFTRTAAAWPEYRIGRRLPLVASGSWRTPCLRHLFLCAYQGRYFGDKGSFVDAFDVLGVLAPFIGSSYLPPYGVGSVWRIRTGLLCEGPCSDDDAYLAADMTSSLAVIGGICSSRRGAPPSSFANSTIVHSGYAAGVVRARSWSF